MARPGLPRANRNHWAAAINRMPGRNASTPGVPDFLQSVPDPIRNAMTPPQVNLEGSGLRVNGNVASRNINGINYQQPLDSITGSGGGIPGFENTPPGLFGALAYDTNQMQNAADQQYARNNQAASDVQGAALGGAGVVGAAGQDAANTLASLGDLFSSLGKQHFDQTQGLLDGVGRDYQNAVANSQGNFETARRTIQQGNSLASGAVSQTNEAVNRDLESAYAIGDEAIAAFTKAISNYQDTTAQDASVVAQAIYRNAEAQKKQIESGLMPDGRQMTVAQRADAMGQLSYDTGVQVQSAITPIFSQFNNNKVQLEQALAGLKFNNANLRLQGTGVRQRGADLAMQAGALGVQAGSALAGIEQAKLDSVAKGEELKLATAQATMQNQQMQQQMAQLVSGLYTNSVQISQAAVLDSARMAIDGLTTTAQLIQQNPRSIVSWFQGLLAMYTANQAMAPEPSFSAPRPRGGGQAPMGGSNKGQAGQPQARGTGGTSGAYGPDYGGAPVNTHGNPNRRPR